MNKNAVKTLNCVQSVMPKIRVVYSVLIALLPILADYIGIFGLGLGTCLLGLFVPYALIYIGSERRNEALGLIVLTLVYFILRFNGYVPTLLLQAAAVLNLAAMAKGAADIRIIRKTVETVAVIATGLILIQYIGYYLFDVKINYLIEALLQDEFKAKVAGAPGTLYRPAAFFLEPAHYTQYCVVALISELFPQERSSLRIKRIIWITAGCVLTTSGMGIVLVVAAFGWFALFYKKSDGKRPVPILFWVLAGLCIFGVLMLIPFFRSTILRIVGKVDDYNALWGRLGSWKDTIAKMTGLSAIFGYGADAEYEWYITGMMKIIYRYGWLGLMLLAAALVRVARVGRKSFISYIVLAYAGLMVIADMSSVYSMVFYVGSCLAMCRGSRNEDQQISVLDSINRLTGLEIEKTGFWKPLLQSAKEKLRGAGQKLLDKQWWKGIFEKIKAFLLELWKKCSDIPGIKAAAGKILEKAKPVCQAAWWKALLSSEWLQTRELIQALLDKKLWKDLLNREAAQIKQLPGKITNKDWWAGEFREFEALWRKNEQ